jgi:hypothetical protein
MSPAVYEFILALKCAHSRYFGPVCITLHLPAFFCTGHQLVYIILQTYSSIHVIYPRPHVTIVRKHQHIVHNTVRYFVHEDKMQEGPTYRTLRYPTQNFGPSLTVLSYCYVHLQVYREASDPTPKSLSNAPIDHIFCNNFL